MSRYFCIFAAVCVAVSAAPPSPPRLYQQVQQQAPAHLQTISPLDYFMDNSEVAEFYNQAQQKQGERGAPARLENLDPDSEVELIAGGQQPQQPPQQNPVNPNVPGLLPGQRGVFIVHMPVPGLRPGTIGGYQPIYIVAAAPQGNTGYSGNGVPVQGVQGIPGYQNAILVNPAAGPRQLVSPYFGYPAQAQYPGGQAQYPGGQAQFPVGQQAGLLFGPAPLGYRGFEPVYQQQVDPGFAYQQAGQQQQQGEGLRGGAVHLSQLVGLQQGQPAHPANQQRTAEAPQNADPKRVGEASESVESKEAMREAPLRNARPAPPHAQRNNKV